MGLRSYDEHKVKDGADYVLTVFGVHTAVAVGAGRGRGGHRLPHTGLLGLIPDQLLSATETHSHTHTHTQPLSIFSPCGFLSF